MTAPTPMSDERLAELERSIAAWVPDRPHILLKLAEVRELVAEVRRGREEVAQLRAPEYAVQVAHDLARASTMTVHEAQQALGVVQDAIDARARVAELEAEIERLRKRHDSRCISLTDSEHNIYCDCRTLAAIDAAKAVEQRMGARVDELEQRNSQLRFDIEALRRMPLRTAEDEAGRDRARSIAVALEAELAQLQATARSVLDDRDRLQDRVLAVRELHDHVHQCADLNWYNPHHSDRAKIAKPGPCPTVRGLDGGGE